MESREEMASIGEKMASILRAERALRGWKRDDIIERSGRLTLSNIRSAEEGKGLSLDRVEAFAEVFGEDPLELITRAYGLDDDEEDLAA